MTSDVAVFRFQAPPRLVAKISFSVKQDSVPSSRPRSRIYPTFRDDEPRPDQADWNVRLAGSSLKGNLSPSSLKRP